MIPKDAEKAIAAHFEIPPNVQRMAERATFDLYYGPIGTEQDHEDDEPYPGFVAACWIVEDWCDDNLSDVWYDDQCGQVLDCEPEGYHEQCCECGGTGNDPAKADEYTEKSAMTRPLYQDLTAEDEDCPLCGGSGESWVEPEWQDFYHFEVGDVKRALFDKELVQYI